MASYIKWRNIPDDSVALSLAYHSIANFKLKFCQCLWQS